MTTVHTIHDEGAIWAQDAWNQAPKELRLRLSKVSPAAAQRPHRSPLSTAPSLTVVNSPIAHRCLSFDFSR